MYRLVVNTFVQEDEYESVDVEGFKDIPNELFKILKKHHSDTKVKEIEISIKEIHKEQNDKLVSMTTLKYFKDEDVWVNIDELINGVVSQFNQMNYIENNKERFQLMGGVPGMVNMNPVMESTTKSGIIL